MQNAQQPDLYHPHSPDMNEMRGLQNWVNPCSGGRPLVPESEAEKHHLLDSAGIMDPATVKQILKDLIGWGVDQRDGKNRQLVQELMEKIDRGLIISAEERIYYHRALGDVAHASERFILVGEKAIFPIPRGVNNVIDECRDQIERVQSEP